MSQPETRKKKNMNKLSGEPLQILAAFWKSKYSSSFSVIGGNCEDGRGFIKKENREYRSLWTKILCVLSSAMPWLMLREDPCLFPNRQAQMDH